MKTMVSIVVFGAAILAGTSALQAGAFDPPWAGESGSTHQEWNFETDATPIAPQVVSNTYGNPTAAVTTGPYTSGWYDSHPVFGSKQGFWDLGSAGTITCTVPNRPLQSESKEIWVQVTYFQDLSSRPVVTVPGAQPIGDPVAPVLIEQGSVGGGWYAVLTKWKLTPSGRSEAVVVTGDAAWGSLIDRVVVDTICQGKALPIAGDANLDCTVNVLDLIFIRTRLGQDPNSGNNWQADVNKDGVINLMDLIVTRNNMNKKCP